MGQGYLFEAPACHMHILDDNRIYFLEMVSTHNQRGPIERVIASSRKVISVYFQTSCSGAFGGIGKARRANQQY